MKRILFLIILIAIGFSSCKVMNPSIMLKTERHYQYDTPPDSTKLSEYKISPNDIIGFRLYSNDGFKIIDLAASGQQNISLQANNFSYRVDQEGIVKLPIIGKVKITGKTIREAELYLEELFSKYYNKPFVMLQITNQRVIVFPGESGKATTIYLKNSNTTLIEALALAGGISNKGKAHKIKLIRGDRDNPKIYLIDLSTMDGIKQANMTLQANDIIYVEPQFHFVRETVEEITPIATLLTSLITIITLFQLTKN